VKLPLYQEKTLSLEELITGCQSDNRKAQKLLYERFAPVMLGLCRRYVRQTEIAEEMLSNGFIKAFRYIRQFENKGSFEGWLRKIMVRECLDHIRKENKLVVSVEAYEPTIEPAQFAEVNLEVEDLIKIIDTLPNGYREVFNLYAIEGYRHAEIAELLGITESTSKTQLMKARSALQRIIELIETR
jgi:RNA polymerase sigma-70 factor (ECF subfamily)